jgi:hypothetical protein
MGKYTINDFKVGDQVYHLSNKKLLMVAVEIHKDMNEISCRWVDNTGHVQRLEFMPEELGKSSDLAPRISVIGL